MSGFHPVETIAGTRRDALLSLGTGIGALALPELLGADTTALAPRSSHHRPRAKHIIHIYLNGGPSQVDTWDPKPVLDRHDGRPIPVGNLTTERETGVALASPFRFQQYGDSERADSVEAAMGDAALHAAQHVTKPSYVS